MDSNTRGFLITDCKDVMLLANLAGQAIQARVREECKLALGEDSPLRSTESYKLFDYPEYQLNPEFDLLNLVFTFNGERRSLHIFFDCDSDHEEYAPKSISISMPSFGFSDLFVKTALHALSILGPAYLNDDSDAEFSLFDEIVPSVLGAISLKYIKTSRLETWVRYFDSGMVGKGLSFSQFFGAAESKVRAILEMSNYSAKESAIQKLCIKQGANPKFLNEYRGAFSR